MRQLVTLVFGVCALASNNRHGWPDEENWQIAPAAAGLFLAFGVLCVNLALRSPGAGVASAIFSSNSVLVLILNAVVLGLVPGLAHLVSMLIVVGGVAMLALSGRAGPPPPPGTPDLTLSLASADLICSVLDLTSGPEYLLRSSSSPSLPSISAVLPYVFSNSELERILF